jgi:type IV secretory pathway VirB2 component (pilin)
MYSPISSLTDPPVHSPIADGAAWVQAALGSAATSVAVVAVAAVGLAMLAGRLELRRGITVVLGCFILFGASAVATTFMELAASSSTSGVRTAPQTSAPPKLPPATRPLQSVYDPYAGASVPTVR